MKLNIDVIIVTKNRPDKLLRCVCSVISNTTLPRSIIIVDSSDRVHRKKKLITSACKRSHIGLVYVIEKRRNIALARNIGIHHSRSTIISFIDDDEIAPDDWIARIIDKFSKTNNLMILCGPKIPMDRNNYWNRIWAITLREDYTFRGHRTFAAGDNTSYRRKIFVKHSLLFDQRMTNSSEDFALSNQLTKLGYKVYFDCHIVVYHEFRTNLLSFAKQWVGYGASQEMFYRYYGGLTQANDPVNHIITTVHKICNLKSWLFRPSILKTPRITFGFIIRDASFLIGYLMSSIRHLIQLLSHQHD